MRGDNGEPGAAGADGDPGPAGPAGPPGKKVIFLRITYRKIPKISPPNISPPPPGGGLYLENCPQIQSKTKQKR